MLNNNSLPNPSKQKAEEILLRFHEEYNGKYDIWAMGLGPAPQCYDAWGKAKREDVKAYSIQVYSSNPDAMNILPKEYEGLPIMVFIDLKELENRESGE